MSDYIAKSVQVHPLNIKHYLRDEIYTMVDEIEDPNNPLPDNDEAQFLTLADPFRKYSYHHARGKLTVYIYLPSTPEVRPARHL